eukprot:1149754-Pelagomonas_calceolata.AAC.8
MKRTGDLRQKSLICSPGGVPRRAPLGCFLHRAFSTSHRPLYNKGKHSVGYTSYLFLKEWAVKCIPVDFSPQHSVLENWVLAWRHWQRTNTAAAKRRTDPKRPFSE